MSTKNSRTSIGKVIHMFKRRKANRDLWIYVSHPAYGEAFTAEEANGLLNAGADPNSVMPESYSPLAHVCVWGNEPVARVLLQHGADPDGNKYGRHIPLHVAAQNGYESLVRLLIGSGADVNLRDQFGQTALHAALLSGSGQKSGVPEILVELGVDPSIRDGFGSTALEGFRSQTHLLLSTPLVGTMTEVSREFEEREARENLWRFEALLGG